MIANVEILNDLANHLKLEVQKELKAQKHSATHELINSVQVSVKRIVNTFRIEGSFLYYGEYVDKGRRAGGKKVPVFVLEEWVKRMNIASGKEALRAAFAIRENIYKYGIPTERGKRIASRRTGFIDEVLNKNKETILKYIERFVMQSATIEIENLVRNTNRQLNIIK